MVTIKNVPIGLSDTIPQPFFFVNKNKDSKFLSRGKDDEAFYIQSYVQSRIRKQKSRAKQVQKFQQASVHSQNPSVAAPYKTTTQRGSRNPQKTNQQTHEESRNKRESPLGLRSAIRNDAGRDATGHYQSTAIAPALGLQPIHGYSLDPFDSASIPIDEHTYQLLQYPFSSFVVNQAAAECLGCLVDPVKKGPFRHNAAIISKLRRCVEDGMVMYAALAASASCIQWAVGDTSKNGKSPEYYMLKAIELLKARLQLAAHVDCWSIMAMRDLSGSCLFITDPAAAKVHMNMLMDCIRKLGGPSCIDRYTWEHVILTDKYLALSTHSRPTFPLFWDPGPLSLANTNEIPVDVTESLVTMGDAFRQADHHLLDHSLLILVDDIITCVQAAHYVAWDSEVEHCFFLRHQSFIYRLLAMQTNDAINETCRLGLLLWLLKITATLGSDRAAKRYLPNLRHALSDILVNKDAHKGIFSLALWATTVGARTAEFVDERKWFVQSATDLGDAIGLPPEKESYRAFLQRYLYVPFEEGLQFARMVKVIRATREGKNVCKDLESMAIK